MEQFTIHLTIGPRSKATFRLTYEEVLKRRLTQYNIDIKVKPKQLVHHFEVDCGWLYAGEPYLGQGSRLSVAMALRTGSGPTVCHPRPEHTGKGLTPWAGSSQFFMGRELPEPSSLLFLSEPQLAHLLNGASCVSQSCHKDHDRY